MRPVSDNFCTRQKLSTKIISALRMPTSLYRKATRHNGTHVPGRDVDVYRVNSKLYMDSLQELRKQADWNVETNQVRCR